MIQVPETQIRALIRLLSDEDFRVAQTITGKLVEIGDRAIPMLREAEIEQPEMAERIRLVLEDIQGQRLDAEFNELSAAHDENLDLETGAFLIAHSAYPDLDRARYCAIMDAMAAEIAELVGEDLEGALDEAGRAVGEAAGAAAADLLQPAQRVAAAVAAAGREGLERAGEGRDLHVPDGTS